MRTLVMGAALAFTALLAFLTLFVIFETGPDVLSVLSLLVLALFFFGIFGALGSGPRDRCDDALPRLPGRPETQAAALAGAARDAGRDRLRGRRGALPHLRARSGAVAAPAAPPPESRLADGAPAPLAGGGTAPSPLSVRLDDPRDLVRCASSARRAPA